MSTQASQSRREHLRGEPKPTPQDRFAYLRVSIVHQLLRAEHVLQDIQKSRPEVTRPAGTGFRWYPQNKAKLLFQPDDSFSIQPTRFLAFLGANLY